jgi:Fe-S cluster assembly iron-binding protein IscA
VKGCGAISFVILGPGAEQAIRSFLAGRGIHQPIRIDLRFSGCCDASLNLCVDEATQTDLRQTYGEGLTFVMDADAHALVGEVTISSADENGRQGFVLVSSKPLSEWEGFSPIGIKV